MVDIELLQAIGKMMDEKLDARFAEFEQKMDKKLEEKLEEKLKPIREELQNLSKRVKRLEILVENNILPRLQNIEACYVSTFERYKNDCERMEKTFEDVDILKKTVKEHSRKLQMIS